MDCSLIEDLIRATEAAAIAVGPHIGGGHADAADQAATDAMRVTLSSVPIRGTVVIGEGERDGAPMLAIGEQIGRWHPDDPAVDIAVDPLECTRACIEGRGGALTCIAIAPAGGLLRAPDLQMHKLAVGPQGRGALDLGRSPTDNVKALADVRGCAVSALRVGVLDRPRNLALMNELDRAGVQLIRLRDGDLEWTVHLGMPNSPIDLYLGIGGAPEGVLGACALHCLGGELQGRLVFQNDRERQRARAMRGADPGQHLRHGDLACGEVLFAASGVTTGALLAGLTHEDGNVVVRSMGLSTGRPLDVRQSRYSAR